MPPNFSTGFMIRTCAVGHCPKTLCNGLRAIIPTVDIALQCVNIMGLIRPTMPGLPGLSRITIAPAPDSRMASSNVPCGTSPARTAYMSVKLTLPKNRPMSGLARLRTKEAIMAVNSAPIMIPTAISITLPLEMKSLNSFNISIPPGLLKQYL
jgi:hypothetical protein